MKLNEHHINIVKVTKQWTSVKKLSGSMTIMKIIEKQLQLMQVNDNDWESMKLVGIHFFFWKSKNTI